MPRNNQAKHPVRFLKVSVVILFLLSFASAGISVFLASIRENEKAKRIYLEGVRSELETQIQTLESEKGELERHVTDLDLQNQDLTTKLNAEQEARIRATNLSRQKDSELQSVREDLKESEKAFSNAQKRNRELEGVLDQLEARLRSMEAQLVPMPPNPEVGYVELKVNPPTSETAPGTLLPAEQTPSVPPILKLIPSEPLRPAAPEIVVKRLSAAPEVPEMTNKVIAKPSVEPSVAPAVVAKTAEKKEEKSLLQPETVLPKFPKKRRFFPFFGSSEKKEEKKDEKEGEKIEGTSAKEARAPAIVPSSEQVQSKAITQELPRSLPQAQVFGSSVQSTVQQRPAAILPTKGAQREVRITEAASLEGKPVTAGKVLLINRKFNFIVMNLGSKQGLGFEDVVRIQKNGAAIAKARVEKLYDDYSAAYITEEQSETPISEGDAVIAS